MADKHRTVICQPECYDQLSAMIPNQYVLGDMLGGLEIILATIPRNGDYVGGPANVWAMRCQIPQSDRAAVIYYTFNDHHVVMHQAMLRAIDS